MARFLLMFKAFGISVFWDVLFLDIVGLTSMNSLDSRTWKRPGLYSSLELPLVTGSRLRWVSEHPLSLLPVLFSLWMKVLVPCAFGLGNGSWLSSALTQWTTVQSNWPSLSPWVGCSKVLHLKTLLSYWETSTLMSTTTRPGVAWLYAWSEPKWSFVTDVHNPSITCP